jgi:hypothetical protein
LENVYKDNCWSLKKKKFFFFFFLPSVFGASFETDGCKRKKPLDQQQQQLKSPQLEIPPRPPPAVTGKKNKK